MLVYIYSDAPLSTIDITDRCRLYQFSVKDQAEEGAVAMSSQTVDDPDGDIEFTGHRRIYVYEDSAPVDNQMVVNGFIVNERVARGPSGRTGRSRHWLLDIADPNVLINRRIMNGADANRPAETDLERIQALLTMTELNTVDDDTYVNTGAATFAMDAVDYRGQNVGSYIDDCRQASGKNAYILYNEPLGEYGLWYDFADSTEYDSGCFLTNTIGENDDETTFLYSQERTYLNRDPSRVASGIYLEYDGGIVYVQDATTLATFAAIDWAAPSINVKTLAKATTRANRYLTDAATEHQIVHVVMTKVPRAHVNKIKKGHLVQFKSTYMTGFEGYQVCRVLYRTVTEISEDPEASFEIEMDLDPVIPLTPISPNAYMCGAYTVAELTTPQQVFWEDAGTDCAFPPLTGVLLQLGTTPFFAGWEAVVDITDFTVHAIARSVPGLNSPDVNTFYAQVDGITVASVSVGTGWSGTDHLILDFTIPLFAAGEQMLFWFDAPPGFPRGVLNNAITGPTYVVGGTIA